jgi:hypothetical protein
MSEWYGNQKNLLLVGETSWKNYLLLKSLKDGYLTKNETEE